MPKPIVGIIPPGGHHYMEGDVKISGSSYKNLLENVTNYRAENYIPVGDVEGDVTNYICGNWPHFCHGVDMVVVTSVASPTARTELMNDISTWARNILYSTERNQLVSDEVAEERAKICRNCPNNVNWRGGCSSCIAATDRICASIRNARDTKSSAVLGGCKLLRHDNRTAIFFDKEKLAESNDLPNFCWLNNNK
jgi:hypothetical protein